MLNALNKFLKMCYLYGGGYILSFILLVITNPFIRVVQFYIYKLMLTKNPILFQFVFISTQLLLMAIVTAPLVFSLKMHAKILFNKFVLKK